MHILLPSAVRALWSFRADWFYVGAVESLFYIGRFARHGVDYGPQSGKTLVRLITSLYNSTPMMGSCTSLRAVF